MARTAPRAEDRRTVRVPPRLRRQHPGLPAIVDQGRALGERAPLLHTADLGVGCQRDRDRLAHPREAPLARLRRLRVFGKHRGETREQRGPIGTLGGLRDLPMLRTLALESLRVKGTELRALLATLPALAHLALNLRLPTADAREVVPHLPALRTLDLAGNRIDADAFIAWLARDHAGLERLVLDGCELAGFALERLPEVRMPALRHLSLANLAIDDDLARVLAAWTTARLDLRGTRVSTELVSELANRPPS